MRPKGNLQEKIFHCGEHYFESLLSDIKTAKHSIDIEVYTFSQDKLGRRIIKALLQARRAKKLKIRLLVDGAGSPRWGGKIIKKLTENGIKTKVFHPFPWGVWQWRLSSTKLSLPLHMLYLVFNMNSRNHRKSILIDNKIAYIGSLNIDQRHLSSANGGQNWRDTAVRIKGANFNSITGAFNKAWEQQPWQQKIDKIVHNFNKNIKLNTSWAKRYLLYKSLLRKVAKAKTRIWITNAYFVPNHLLLKKLKKLASSGIDIRIILPQKSDVAAMQWAGNTFYCKLIKSGIKIYEYKPSVLHAKTIIIDDWMQVGSSNLNHRSLLHDLEIDFIIGSHSAKEQLIRQFLLDQNNSQEITLTSIPKIKFYQRIIGNMFVLCKYWV